MRKKYRTTTERYFNSANDTKLEATMDAFDGNSSVSTFGSNNDIASQTQWQHCKNVREESFQIGKMLVQSSCSEDYNWKSLEAKIEIPVDFGLPKRRKSKRIISDESLYFDYALSDSESYADHNSLYRLDSDSSLFESNLRLVRQANVKRSVNKDTMEKSVEEEKQIDHSLVYKESIDRSLSRKVSPCRLREKIKGGFHSILAELNMSNILDSNKIENNSSKSDDTDNKSKSEELSISSGDKISKFEQIPLVSSPHEIYIDDNLARQDYIKMLEQEVVSLKIKLADVKSSLDQVQYLEQEHAQEVEMMKMKLTNIENKNSDKTSITPSVESIHDKVKKDKSDSENEMRSMLKFPWRPKSKWRHT